MPQIKKFGNLEYRVSKAGNHATVVVLDTKIDLSTGFSNTRVAFVRVPIKLIDIALEQIKSSIEKGTARIALHDYAEDDAAVLKVFGVSDEYPLEKAIEPYIRKSGEKGIPLTIKGSRIIRKGIFDEHGTIEDVIIEHDNYAEISAHRVAMKSATATTPTATAPAAAALDLAAASVAAELPVND